jgi:5-methylcytosine-specific restriction endonuclease McrA
MITSTKVLVLNKNWTAIGITSLQRSMSLLYSEYENGEPKAHIVTPPPKGSYEVWSWKDWSELFPSEGENGIVSAKRVYKVPEVILLSRYEEVPSTRVNFCRRAIWKRDEFRCQYCGVRPNYDEATLDHIIPRSCGGETSWTNCVLACYRCNSQKADREPHQAFRPKDKEKAKFWRGPSPMKLLKEPNRPEFSIFRGEYRIKVLDTWKHWIDKLYWDITLDNDMEEEDLDIAKLAYEN